MKKFKILILIFAVSLSLGGCVTLGSLWDLGSEGYSSQEGKTAGAAAQVIATPLVGQPIATAIAGIVSLLAGGFAVYKRQKYLDTPVKKS